MWNWLKMTHQKSQALVESLSPLKEEIINFLKGNLDVFAWSHGDVHNIDRRVFAPVQNKAVIEEVDKLLTAGLIREVCYLDMVKKPDGKWRMCMSFMNLSSACPKYNFPLPRISQLVDSTARHELLTFMDAFLVYN